MVCLFVCFCYVFFNGSKKLLREASRACLQYISKGKLSHVLCRHMIVTADVILLRATAVIKMALRPGAGGGSRYFTPFKRLFLYVVACFRHAFVSGCPLATR